jgi:Uma2 family endonuclease
MTITSISQLDLNKVYTYADYLKWQFEERLELIKGKVFKMSPAPSTRHQKISRNLSFFLGNIFLGLSCQYFFAPFDVRLLDRKKSIESDEDIFTVVQPDLCIICDEDKIDEKGCIGAPDLIIEIVSGKSKREVREKFGLYEESGVKEYWIVYQDIEHIHQYKLGEGEKYEIIKIYTPDDTISSAIFPDLKIDVHEIFRF